ARARGRPCGPMFINLLLPNYPLLQIKNNSMAAANRTGGPASQRRTAYFCPTTYRRKKDKLYGLFRGKLNL
ncbi:MAG: hypothetical protein EAZ80_12775, partial [Runella slithyformis]